jgi:hypothetical protein
VVSKTYRVVVPENTNFEQGWPDLATPNMLYNYDQQSLEECEFIDGIYYATYQTWVVEQERIMEVAMPNGVEFITIPVGEYGVRP